MKQSICKLKLRRGKESERTTIIPEDGEPIYTIDNHRLFIGDGSTKGGHIIGNKVFTTPTTSTQRLLGDIYKDGNAYKIHINGNNGDIQLTHNVNVDTPLSVETNNNIHTLALLKNDSDFTVSSGILALVPEIARVADVAAVSGAVKEQLANIPTQSVSPIYTGQFVVTAIDGIGIGDLTAAQLSGLDGVQNHGDSTYSILLSAGYLCKFNDNNNKYELITNSQNKNIGKFGIGVYNKLLYSTTSDKINIQTLNSITVKNITTDITSSLITFDSVSEVDALKISNSGGSSGGDFTLTKDCIKTDYIQNNAVTKDKIANGNVTEEKLAVDVQNKLNKIGETVTPINIQSNELQFNRSFNLTNSNDADFVSNCKAFFGTTTFKQNTWMSLPNSVKTTIDDCAKFYWGWSASDTNQYINNLKNINGLLYVSVRSSRGIVYIKVNDEQMVVVSDTYNDADNDNAGDGTISIPISLYDLYNISSDEGIGIKIKFTVIDKNAADWKNNIHIKFIPYKSSIIQDANSDKITINNNTYNNVKLDASAGYLVESKETVDSTSGVRKWYRLYSDGWLEQGGSFTVGGTATISLAHAFQDTNYVALVASNKNLSGNIPHVTNKETTRFTTYVAGGGTWYACGWADID